MAFASRTGPKRNLEALRTAGWGLLVSATGCHRTEGFPYCLDNGAWTAYQKNLPWQEEPFIKLVSNLGAEAIFVTAPDIVAGGADSLALSIRWLPWLLERCKVVLIPVQDGMTGDQVSPLIGPRVGVFLGGSTQWKLRTMFAWGTLARERERLITMSAALIQ